MVKIVLKFITVLALAGNLFAGTAGGGADGRLFNTAYFDVHTKSQAPMLDYIKYSKRGSFDIKQFADTVSRIHEKKITVYVHGRVVVPDDIETKKVYVSVGPNYHYSAFPGWAKEIRYNGAKQYQNAEYFLVDTKTDAFGKRYIDYKITLNLVEPWNIKPSEKNVAPNTFFFQMAPQTRGFKNKFEPAEIYVLDE